MKEWLMKLVFEKMFPLKWLDGYKTQLSQFVTFLSAALYLLVEHYPTYSSLVTPAQAGIATICGLIGVTLGQAHKIQKLKEK